MSSEVPNSMKKEASEPSQDEPNTKKVRISETSHQNDVENSTLKKNNDTDQNDNIEQNNKAAPNKSIPNNNTDNRTDGDGERFGEAPFDMDPKVAKALDGVEAIQAELQILNEKASDEILKVEQKFNKLRRPLFEKRNETLKDIPNFWVTTLANHHVTAPMLESDQDEGCLHYLTTLDVEDGEDIKSGYQIKFHFAENPYIANEVITKSFEIIKSDDMRSSSTAIEYKNTPQGNALKEVVKQSTEIYRNSRYSMNGQPLSSFFAWITEKCEVNGTDEVADALRDQIWPSPLDYFFASSEDYDNPSDEDDSEDDDDDDEDGLDEGDEIEDVEDDGAYMSEELGDDLPSEEEDDDENDDLDEEDYPDEE